MNIYTWIEMKTNVSPPPQMISLFKISASSTEKRKEPFCAGPSLKEDVSQLAFVSDAAYCFLPFRTSPEPREGEMLFSSSSCGTFCLVYRHLTRHKIRMILVGMFCCGLGALKYKSFYVFFLQTEHLPLQTPFKEREVGSRQHSNGLSSRRFDYEDENPAEEDGIQQMRALSSQMCYQDWSPGGHHHSDGPGRVCINSREHYV
nr:uncharacterized protein LOC111748348 [Loxodonta africana]